MNTAAIAAAGVAGSFIGKAFDEQKQSALIMACGVSTLFIGIAGAMEGMLSLQNGALVGGRAMLVVICLTLGALIGESIGIEDGFERLGEWLRQKSGNARDPRFVDAFVTASLTVCIGAMAIMGSIEDGIKGDFSTLAVKSVLDFIIIVMMTASMGKGCGFFAVPVLMVEGSITLLSRLIAPVMTEAATANLSLVGSILIFCVGLNLVWGKRVRVANLLPAVVLAVIVEYLPLRL